MSSEDPHSFARPELARVTNSHLELNVDFERKVLKGKVILTIEIKNSSITEVILDNYELVILQVTNPLTGASLKYHIKNHHAFGSVFTIQLPRIVQNYKPTCEIQIEYETSPNSPALYWLTPLQTADGTSPFLICNNKLTNARAVFPCQDTPSAKFSYTAKISVPKNFTVIMSALLQNVSENQQLTVYEFLQTKLVPSYAVVIAVGSLQKKQLSARSNVFAENKFINESVDTFSSGTIENMLQFAEDLCGPYFWDRYDVCVLPPSIGHFQIECPCVTFVSPILLRGDSSIVCTLALNIAQSWAGNLVTCVNYNHLWLNKSFSMFICRKIICKILNYEEGTLFYQRLGISDMHKAVKNLGSIGLLKNLIPDLKNVLPSDAIKYVPYEVGCILLSVLEMMLGGSSIFEPFFKSYFYKFAYQSIKTDDWQEYLHDFFPEKKEVLNSIKWNVWFYSTIPLPDLPKMTMWEELCYNLAEAWASWDGDAYNIPTILSEKLDFCDFQKIMLLINLHYFYMDLTEKKMILILNIYDFETQNYRIRFLWLLLCVKIKWVEKILTAWDCAIQFCSPDYVSVMFQHLSKLPGIRLFLIETFVKDKEKMSYETQNKLKSILQFDFV